MLKATRTKFGGRDPHFCISRSGSLPGAWIDYVVEACIKVSAAYGRVGERGSSYVVLLGLVNS